MNEFKFLPFFICTALFSVIALLYFRGPFYEYAVAAAFVSVPFILLLPRKWLSALLFLILIAAIGTAFQAPAASLGSVGNYFLLSVFQCSLWAVSEQVKLLEEETVRLEEQRLSLLQKDGELRALELQEFVEQALWMLKTGKRRERAWLMEVTPFVNCPIKTSELEKAALQSIVRERDLVTSRKGAVYVLVKETEEDSIQPLLKRIEQVMGAKSEPASYEVKKTAITTVGEMGSLLS
ncbi:hypothetical protein KQ939_05365 [Planococcus sp. CP5-4]|uniref:hypothetical protein n=1 Tax=unclassified Planococcus (in: firmicutes) TaxID=2662419 RepID=UPI001C221BE6|nr:MULTISPECIES: hypothetical protein [unclassified Planococcus (in: firmicutes)]MBU9673690.1 hypothetical protein [Planococcus sp. CP5-4_YE]MBV0907980.1 hypothetical protein [Planococcus sp. CP5-4_UN]MBW6063147.1 hypothetical protein [Planococcus sp. CP5-4]